MTVANARQSRSYEVVHRIARRFGPLVAAAYVRAVGRVQAGIDDRELLSALASGDLNQIEAVLGANRLQALFAGNDALADLLNRIAIASAQSSAEVVAQATGVPFRFDAMRPNTVIAARAQSGFLVVGIAEDIREAVQVVIAAGALDGLTLPQQARAIRQVVGLPPNWAAAPVNLGNELRAGTFTSSRRLSAIDKARIRKALREGTVTESFIAEMQDRYAASLVNRRALNIARTETLRAAHMGQRDAWRQGVQDGVIPETARRVWIVTPDDRLRDEHAAIPGMNPDGVGLDESFDTPFGPVLDPPAEPNCRCGVGLTFGRGGVI